MAFPDIFFTNSTDIGTTERVVRCNTMQTDETNNQWSALWILNAQAIYQHVQEKSLRDMHLNIFYIYLDDLIIFLMTFKYI